MEQALVRGELLDGKYRIDALLGQGGMGAVYRATHLGTTRTVAIKVIQPRLSPRRAEFVARFEREAEAAGRLRHPNVVDVTDFGFAGTRRGEVAYLVMEYLDGCTLADILSEERVLPVSWVVDILDQVCSALDEAHGYGMIHRDLKPENIWLEPNRRGGHTVKVLDFGLVKLGSSTRDEPLRHAGAAPDDDVVAPTAPDSSETAAVTIVVPQSSPDLGETMADAVTRVGHVTGTPDYMSPEQCRGGAVDARTDIYSLGIIAYRMLAGATPFAGDTRAVMQMHLTETPASVRARNRRVPKGVDRLIMAALAKEPAQRPATAGGFASALRASAEGSGTLLRQAMALYSDRFPVMFKGSLVAYAPLIAIVLSLYAADTMKLKFIPLLAAQLLMFAMIAANLAAYFIVSAALAPLVAQSIVSPLQELKLATAWRALRRRWWTLAVTTAIVTASTFVGTLLFVAPGVLVATMHVLYAPVAVMENEGVIRTLRRARGLAWRSWSTVAIITVLQFALPVVVWMLSVDGSFELTLDDNWQLKQFGFGLSMSGTSGLYQLLNIFITPLTATMTALLYLKTRQAGGESLKAIVERVTRGEVVRSKWQARVHSHAAQVDTPPAQAGT